MSLDRAAREVLSRYPVGIASRVEALGNRGGFSGARLWRCEGLASAFCLRAWPENGITVPLLETTHEWMQAARDLGLTFVPAVLTTLDGRTCVAHADRLWEITTWMPGRADFHDRPSTARVAAACTAVAQLHGAWEEFREPDGLCPAVQRRLAVAQTWAELLETGWQPAFGSDPADPIRPWAEQAWHALRHQASAIPGLLASWRSRSLPRQPCLCDVWHDHVLFTGDNVTGVVDYGSVKMDHVAVDVARLLGSLAGNDRELWTAGLVAYRAVRSLTAEEEELIDVLDVTGTLLGTANWLMWIYHERRRYDDRQLVARRLTALVRRLEACVYSSARRIGSER